MATYAIGDIQGCFLTLQKLLRFISFDERKDRLILLGDVVNRGPMSLEVLRFIFEHQDSISIVLGNHDLLAIALFLQATDRPHTMQRLLDAPDAPQLIDWLRHQPLMRLEEDRLFVHAGIVPTKKVQEALAQARLAEERLCGSHAHTFLTEYYEQRLCEHDELGSLEPSLQALLYMTLIRMCTKDGLMVRYDGDLPKAPAELFPWFTLRKEPEPFMYFGHWAALGLHRYGHYYCLDSGCVWGNKLSALRLEDHKLFQVASSEVSPLSPH